MLVLLFALEKTLHKNPFSLNLLSFSSMKASLKARTVGLPALPALALLLRTAWLHAFVVTIK